MDIEMNDLNSNSNANIKKKKGKNKNKNYNSNNGNNSNSNNIDIDMNSGNSGNITVTKPMPDTCGSLPNWIYYNKYGSILKFSDENFGKFSDYYNKPDCPFSNVNFPYNNSKFNNLYTQDRMQFFNYGYHSEISEKNLKS